MKTSHAVLAMLAASLGGAALIVGMGARPAGPTAAEAAASDIGVPAPWAVRADPDGLHALGLVLGRSTLADAVQRFGPDTQIAVIAAPNEVGHLEAFVDPLQAGFVGGKLVISAQATAAQIEGWKARAVKAEFMESTTRRHLLATGDQADALRATVTGLSFIPQAQLDEAAVVARFGPPAEKLPQGDHVVHLLYPAQGVDVVVDSQGKELVQYVPPAEFEARLRMPLLQVRAEPPGRPVSEPAAAR